jgi:predicted adenine nucleotide alpha hydrolase (AANH) superfamily ATPase
MGRSKWQVLVYTYNANVHHMHREYMRRMQSLGNCPERVRIYQYSGDLEPYLNWNVCMYCTNIEPKKNSSYLGTAKLRRMNQSLTLNRR